MLRPEENQQQAGFSLLELLVAMGLMLVVLTSVFALMRDSIKVSTTTYEMTDAQQSLRVIQEYINRDLVNAGNGFRSVSPPRLPRDFVNNYLTATPAGDYVQLGIVNSGDNAAAGTAIPASPTLAASTVLAASDRITMLSEDPDPNFPVTATWRNEYEFTVPSTDIGKFRVGEIYFITAGGSLNSFVHIKSISSNRITCDASGGGGGGGVTDLDINDKPSGLSAINYVSGSGATSFQIKRVQIVTYFVNADKLLVRRVFGIRGTNITGTVGGVAEQNRRAFADSVIAEQVSGLQFLYQVQQTGANGNLVAPLASLDTSLQRTNLRQVQVTPTVQTFRPITRRVNAQTGATENAPQELSSTTTIGLRNLQFINNSIL